MSIGYSFKTVELNKGADKTRLGVSLGKLCINLNIPVVVISSKLGVSRQTVYNWFTGEHDPHESHVREITKLINSFKSK
jgi:hypothetical protein